MLTAVLITGTVWNAAPLDVRAQENAEAQPQTEADAQEQEPQQPQSAEEESPTHAAETAKPQQTAEEPAAGQTQDAAAEQDTALKQETPERTVESAPTEEAPSENTTETAEEQPVQEAQNTAGSGNLAQGEANLAQGEGWSIDADGVLIIETDDGFADWVKNGLLLYCHEVKKAVIKNGVHTIPECAFGCYNICQYMVSVETPDTVTAIEADAFNGCMQLQSIEIPNTVTSMGASVFASCGALSSCKLPENEKFTDIPAGCFEYCEKLAQIDIPNSVTSIGRTAFWETGLTSVTIPAKVTSIGDSAFAWCDKLETVYMLPTEPPTLDGTVFGTNGGSSSCKFITDGTQGIHVPESSVEKYKANWSRYEKCIAADTPPVQHIHKDHNNNDVSFTAWDKDDSLPDTAGSYYLTKDVKLSGEWSVPEGEINICLNDNTIIIKYTMIKIPSHAKVG